MCLWNWHWEWLLAEEFIVGPKSILIYEITSTSKFFVAWFQEITLLNKIYLKKYEFHALIASFQEERKEIEAPSKSMFWHINRQHLITANIIILHVMVLKSKSDQNTWTEHPQRPTLSKGFRKEKVFTSESHAKKGFSYNYTMLLNLRLYRIIMGWKLVSRGS